MKCFVGIDVSKLSLDIAVLPESGETKHHKVENNEVGHQALLEWLSELGLYQVILEATGSYHQNLLAYLQAHQQVVTVLNPRQSNAYAKSLNRRNKTDQVDALILARYGRERQPQESLSAVPSQQSLAREIEALSEDIGRLRNRLEAAEQGVTHPEIVLSLKRRIQTLKDEKKTLEKQLEQNFKQHQPKQLTLLESIGSAF
jgi:transposase